MKTKRLYTWAEACASVREGAGEEAVKQFDKAMRTIAEANYELRNLQQEKLAAVACALEMIQEHIGDGQVIGPDGGIFERQTGVSVSYPKERLLAAGVTEEQLAQSRKETPWATVAGAKK